MKLASAHLGPCPNGIGVFTDRPLKKGEPIHLWQRGDWKIWRPKNYEELVWANKWCIYAWEAFYGPRNPHQMSLAWYVNHSSRPNLDTSFSHKGKWTFTARRKIRTGEQLTVNYSALDYYGK